MNRVSLENNSYHTDLFSLPKGFKILTNCKREFEKFPTDLEIEYFGNKMDIEMSAAGYYILEKYFNPISNRQVYPKMILGFPWEQGLHLFRQCIKIVHREGLNVLMNSFQFQARKYLSREPDNFVKREQVYLGDEGQVLLRVEFFRKYNIWFGYDYARSMYLFEFDGTQYLDQSKIIATEDWVGCVSDALQYAVFGK